jgi:hypothetical protein
MARTAARGAGHSMSLLAMPELWLAVAAMSLHALVFLLITD